MSLKTTSRRHHRLTALLTLLLIALVAGPAGAQDEGRAARMAAAGAVRAMVEGSGDASLRSFVAEHLAPAYRDALSEDEMLAHLRALRAAARGADGLDLERRPEGLAMIFSGPQTAVIEVRLGAGGITELGVEIQDGSAPDPRQAQRRRVRAVEGLGASAGDESLRAFAAEHLAESFVASLGDAELLDLLRRIRKAAAAAGTISVSGTDGGVKIEFRGSRSADIEVAIADAEPFLITSLTVDTDVAAGDDAAEPVEPITWDTLERRLEEAARDGFSGTVLVTRRGEIVLHRAYGMANRERGLANTTETIFGIGSTPIDFTRAAVFLLEQRGRLSLSDKVTRFFPQAPADKRAMTLDHLMTARSGLPNFHHIPGTDADYDLTWIDRDTAVERILGQELLFAPGEGESHSHSAYVLLAAIVEIASGASYGDFLRTNFFAPAGMTRTGFYGPNPAFDDDDFAVGYGPSRVGKLNIPLYWGETSWLAMGSGGMFSTPADMLRWSRFVTSGKVLSGEALEKYRFRGLVAGGSDRGFLFLYTGGSQNQMFLSSNVFERGHGARELARTLADLVMNDDEP